MSAQTFVFISASSPLFNYAPTRNGPIGSSWNQIEDGSQCAGPATFAVQLDNLYFSEITYFWQASGNFAVSVGLDGALQSGSATSGGVSLSAQSGPHDARLEVGCKDCGSVGEIFTLRGVRLTTDLTGTNATLDDSSPSITYQGFTSTNAGSRNIPAIANGVFFQQTVSYTSTSGSTASFSFEGSALYVFGPTGPAFGSFSVEIDGNSLGSFNASTTLDTYDNLLFFVSHLATSTSHTAKFTCQNEGLIFALDRFVAVQGTVGSGTGAGGPNTVVAGPTVTTINGVTTTIGGTNPTAVFPIQTPVNETPGGHNGSAAAAIGGTLGALAAVILFWIWWRYRRYRKAGGEGDFLAGCCGPWGRARAAAKAEEAKFKMWPMLSFKPKYAT